MRTPGNLTESAGRHLVAIANLRRSRGYARVSDVAKSLGITRGSASLTLKSLKKKGFVQEDENRFLMLTNEGRNQAEGILEKKQLLYRLLAEVLELPHEVADEDSHRLEHLLSNQAAGQLARFLKLYQRATPEIEWFRRAWSEFDPPCVRYPEECQACFARCFVNGVEDSSLSSRPLGS